MGWRDDNCCCPHPDASFCFITRYCLTPEDEEWPEAFCECSCHEPDEDDYDDEDDYR